MVMLGLTYSSKVVLYFPSPLKYHPSREENDVGVVPNLRYHSTSSGRPMSRRTNSGHLG